jgi:hypothetical protein
MGESPRGIKQMTDTKRGTSSVALVMMARAAQRLAQHNDDPEMMAEAKEYETRALDAIRQGRSELDL